jgi:cytochrome c oxidase subunit 1
MVSTLAFFAVGVSLGFVMRLELLTGGKTVVEAGTYNQIFTTHGVIMIFLFIVPVTPAILGNFFLPLQIGARDVAFPRLNLLSWWFYMAGAVIILISLFAGPGAADTGWTFYAPYSLLSGRNVTLAVFGVFILGFSSILTGMNFITTVHRLRVRGMTWFRMPLFVWSLYATAWMQLLATPVVGVTLLMIMAERYLGIGVFNPALGGDPILYQHLFWIYSHPAVYIMILPAMGIVAEVIPVFARKVIFGYKAIAYSSIAIAVFGSMVWGHHMFVSGYSYTAGVIFSLFTFLVAVPSAIKVFNWAIKVFNWVATLHKGSVVVEPPLLFALAFIFQFSIGGLTGLMLGSLTMNVHLHDTYFVVGHFHYVKFGGAAFGLFAGLHYWFPKIFGRMYDRAFANRAFAILFVGFNALYFPMLLLGIEGMPRRYYDYLPRYHDLQVVSIVGSWILVAGLLLMFFNLLRSIRHGERCGPNPWGAATLEWQTASPPPKENFEETPKAERGPYDFRSLDIE